MPQEPDSQASGAFLQYPGSGLAFFHTAASIPAVQSNTWFGIAASFSRSIARNCAHENCARQVQNVVRQGFVEFAIEIETGKAVATVMCD